MENTTVIEVNPPTIAKPFCDTCTSRGFRHKNGCPKAVSRTPKVDRVEELAKKVDQLTDILIPLAEKVMNSEKVSQIPPQAQIPPSSAVVQNLTEMKEAEDLTKTLIPKKWNEAVREILGAGFDLEINEAGHGNFSISILLPLGLDRRVPRDSKTRDVSTGLVRRATAEFDVRNWCELVKKNIQSTTTYKFV